MKSLLQGIASFFQPEEKVLHLQLTNASKRLASPLTLDIIIARTTIKDVQEFIRQNGSYTGYPHRHPHVLVINQSRIGLTEFMAENSSNNFYSYLKSHGFKPSAENPNAGSIAISTCTIYLRLTENSGTVYYR